MGIGAAIAKALAREGAQVLVNHRSSEKEAEEVVKDIRNSGGRAVQVKADVSDPSAVSEMFDFVARSFGRLDVLVNCAGVADPAIWNAKLNEINEEMWNKVISVDVVGNFRCTQLAVPLMTGGGSIVNISSTTVLMGDTQGLIYACAKAANLTETKMLARILAPKIRVNCMVLGSIQTGWVDWLDEETLTSYRSSISLRRFGRPDEVGSVAVFLASEDSSYVTGQSLVVDGGDVMH